MTKMRENLDAIKWTRFSLPFEVTLGKYIIKKTFELAQGPKVLDVACGNGSLTKLMADHYPIVVGVDGSKEKIKLARKNAPKAKFYVSMFEDFDLDERFNSLVMINILEHVEDPVVFLKKAKSLLNQGGEVVAFVPNALSLNRRIGKIMGIIEDHYELSANDLAVGHRRFYDRDKLVMDLLESGFMPEDVGGVLLKPLSNKQMESWDLEAVEALYVIGEELPDYCGLIYASAGVV